MRTVNVLDRRVAYDYGAALIGQRNHALPTGFATWDQSCAETGGIGLGDWWYVVIGGASNAGKTRLGLHLARQAVEAGRDIGLISMEVPLQGIQRSVYSNVTTFGYYDFLPRKWELNDPVGATDRLAAEVGEYAGDRGRMLVVEHDRSLTLETLMGACEDLVAEGVSYILVDHLQLIRAAPAEISDRATEISEALRHFAHSQRVLVIALSQINRLASRERGHLPSMHDLLGGTSIESNANQVVMIAHNLQARDGERPHILRTYLSLDKNREGPARQLFPVECNFKTGVWREALPDEVHLWPKAE